MRSETPTTRQTAYLDRRSSSIGSPPREDIWLTERRLAEKPVPGAPVKASRARPYLPDLSPFQTMDRNSMQLADTARILLPSKTIDEDDDCCMAVSLPFRSERMTFSFGEDTGADPTTVLLGPSSSSGGILSWHEDEDDDMASVMEDDNDMSPRLFHRFSNRTLSRYESIEMAEDECDTIFRAPEDDEPPSIQERFTSSPLQRCKDDVRI